MTITKERLISIIVGFFKDIKKQSYYALEKKTNIHQKTLKSWKYQKTDSIRYSSISNFISIMQDDILREYKNFTDHLLSELEKDGISNDNIKDLVLNSEDILSLFDKLLEVDLSTPIAPVTLQERIGTAGIIQDIKSLLSGYRDYFQISEKSIGENDAMDYFSSLVYTPKYATSSGTASVTEPNYIIVRFPNAYHVCIILSNRPIEKRTVNFSLMIEKLKAQHDLEMIIIVTDNSKKSIPLSVQSMFMEQHNLFFEFVKPDALKKIPIQGLELSEDDTSDLQNRIDRYRYAQLIFERFMSYLAVISNEIVFLPFLEKLHKELDLETEQQAISNLNKLLVSYQKRSNENNFSTYARNLLLKDICSYSYLSRHAVYHERALVESTLASYLKDDAAKIPLAVEICAPNSLTTIDILDRCEKLLLFTASHTAYSVMSKLHEKSENRFLPKNVELRLSHLNPEYIMHQYTDEFTGKIDLLVIGFGSGSQIDDLTTFLRYAYNWLSENGILFISVYNKDAIVLDKNHLRDQRFESSPLFLSDYWTYARNGKPSLLRKLKSYSPDGFQSTYLSLFDTQEDDFSTYPYLSALINPNDYNRDILDEIRNADKLFAKHGIHGQLINVIGRKNKNRLAKESVDIVKEYLQNSKIAYQLFSHTLAPDSISLRRSLQAQNISMANAIVLKTVILQEISNKKKWHFAILPYDKKVAYDHTRYELVPETLVIKHFHQGTISPLTVMAETILKEYTFENVYLLFSDKLSTEFVIMGCGSNSESVQMKTNAFRKLIKKHKITLTNLLE